MLLAGDKRPLARAKSLWSDSACTAQSVDVSSNKCLRQNFWTIKNTQLQVLEDNLKGGEDVLTKSGIVFPTWAQRL